MPDGGTEIADSTINNIFSLAKVSALVRIEEMDGAVRAAGRDAKIRKIQSMKDLPVVAEALDVTFSSVDESK